MAVTSRENPPEEGGGGGAHTLAQSGDTPPRAPDAIRLAALLAEDRAALGRKPIQSNVDQDAGPAEAEFDAQEVTAVSHVGIDDEPSAPELFETLDSDSIRSEPQTSAESQFDRLEVTSVGSSQKEAAAPRKAGGAGEMKGPTGGRRQHLTPGGQRIAALLAQTRAKTGQHEPVGVGSGGDARGANAGHNVLPTGTPRDGREARTPNPNATLLGVSAPDMQMVWAAEKAREKTGAAGPASGSARAGRAGHGQAGSAQDVGFSLADEAEFTERNAAAPAYAAASTASSGGVDSSGSVSLKGRPRGAIWIVLATAMVVLAVGMLLPRSRKTNDSRSTAPVAAPAAAPVVVPNNQQPPQTPPPGSTAASESSTAAPQQPSSGQASGSAETPAAAQPAAAAEERAAAEDDRARSTGTESEDGSASAATTEGSSADSPRKRRAERAERRAEARRKRKAAKATKSGSQHAEPAVGVSTPSTERPKTRSQSGRVDDPDATLPLIVH